MSTYPVAGEAQAKEWRRLCFAPAHQLAVWIRAGQVSAVEVLEAHLAQIERLNPDLAALILLDEEEACKRAHRAELARCRGHLWGPLHGVPFTVKDHMDVAGMRSTMGGYPPYAQRIPEEDATVVARLKAAGAILLGRTNAEFFPYGTYPPSNNPWDLSRSPGRSSSGAAAALAAGLTPLDIGSDADGSILFPAHNCGIFGFRPTQGRVSLDGLTCPWFAHLFRQMTVFGPMARCAADLALVMSIIGGPDGRDFSVPPVNWRATTKIGWPELRVAWSPAIPGSRISREIQSAVERLVVRLARRGVHLEEGYPAVDFARQAALNQELKVDLIRNALGQPDVPANSGLEHNTLACYLRLLDERERIIGDWENFFAGWDAFLCPAAGLAAGRHEEIVRIVDGRPVGEDELLLPLRLVATSGHPAVVLPLDLDRKGLPFGLLLIGRRWEDEKLLAIAGHLESLTGGFRRPPLARFR